jgi:hypothetical protein
MTLVCPSGHSSATSDYCDQCGAPISGAPPASQPTEILDAIEEVDTSAAALQQPCPLCGAPRSGDDRYCEGCGHDFLAPPGATAWEAVVYADRQQFERLAVEGIQFPSDCPERRYVLTKDEVLIGRSRPGEQPPDIDLASAPEDPGVSRRHAVLERQADGAYALRDPGSTNGTMLNNDPVPVAKDDPVTLRNGDLIRLGAWTTIALRSR